jgi:hypothetical protein
VDRKYNIYILIDPRTKLPFYVGKGKGKRFNQHKKEYNKQIEYFSKVYKHPIIQLSLKHLVFYELSELNLEYELEIIECLTEEEAFLLEQGLIAWLGRKICGNGILTNLLSGGKKGNLYFDDQALIEIYRNDLLREYLLKFPKTSSEWIARTLYFRDEISNGYPFKELKIDWLYQFHQCNQQFALKVIEILKNHDAVITPYYWVRKINRKPYEEDNVYVMDESFKYILEESQLQMRKDEFNKYKEELSNQKK